MDNDEIIFNNSYNNINLDIFDQKKTFNNKIHLRYYQRNKRKTITIIEGLDDYNLDLKKFIKFIKKKYCCSGCKKKDDDNKTILQFQGDLRNEIHNLLKNTYNIEEIIIHG